MHRMAVLITLALVARAQVPTQDASALRFEVASLKTSPPGGRGGGIRPAPGGERYLANGVPLQLMIMVAYRIKADQISGGPAWINSERFDMNAKAERPSTVEELHTMLKNLLADRFQLSFHRETRELPVYALTIDKAGTRMTPHAAQSAGDPWIDQSIEQVVSVKMKAAFVPMDYFAWRLGQLLDRPVIDLTKLQGGYDFTLAYTRDLPPGLNEGALLNGAPIDTSGPTIFQALRQQLGLKLEAQKGPVEVLVIDRAEKPAAN